MSPNYLNKAETWCYDVATRHTVTRDIAEQCSAPYKAAALARVLLSSMSHVFVTLAPFVTRDS